MESTQEQHPALATPETHPEGALVVADGIKHTVLRWSPDGSYATLMPSDEACCEIFPAAEVIAYQPIDNTPPEPYDWSAAVKKFSEGVSVGDAHRTIFLLARDLQTLDPKSPHYALAIGGIYVCLEILNQRTLDDHAAMKRAAINRANQRVGFTGSQGWALR